MALSWMLKPRWVVFAGLCCAAVLLAAIRFNQLVVEQAVDEVHFSDLHNVRWNPNDGTLVPTGDDPHAYLEIPAESIPLTGVTMDFSGPLPPGPSYIYPSPAHYPGLQISDDSVVTGTVAPIEGGFALRFKLPPCRLARFDLPDNLHSAFVLRRIVFETPFAGSTSAIFSLFVGTLISAVVLLGWTYVRPFAIRHRAIQVACAAVLVGVKLWVAADLHLTIFPDAHHDDALFMSLGHSIANGDWLGQFNELTLSKGPTFPIFIAIVQLTGIPFLRAEALFHAVACLVFVLALCPLVRSPTLRLGLLATLLFDPHTLSVQVVAQVLRSGIQPALTLLALAGFIGLLARVRSRPLALVPWAVLAGVALALFWYSREESVWLAPTVALLVGATLWRTWQLGKDQRWMRVGLCVLPVTIWFGARATLKAVNHHYYGESITIDVADGGYPEAYAALTRITPAERIPGVPVTKETRERAYAVSPAFAELRPYLEGKIGIAWAQNGWEGIDHPAARREIRGWFQWALREAARAAGRYEDAAAASSYWQKVAQEINDACDSGKLKAGPRRSGFLPQWDQSLWPVFGESFRTALGIVTRFTDFNPQCPPSSGNPDRIAFFSRMLHEPPVLQRMPPTPRTHVRVMLYHFYASLGGVASVASIIGLLVVCLHFRRHAELSIRGLVLLALVGGIFSLTLIIALVDATSFSTTHAMYLAPATPLALAVWLLAPAWAFESFANRAAFIKSVSDAFKQLSNRLRPIFRRLSDARAAATLLAVAALVFAGIRWFETTTVIQGRDVEFKVLNEMRWDSASRQVVRAGGDPFGIFNLPKRSIPIRKAIIVFEGPYVEGEGVFYAFQHPANMPGDAVQPNSLTQGSVVRNGPEFTVSWTLQNTSVLRVDLPDFLQHPLEIKSVTLKTAYAWAGSTSFRFLILSLGGLAVCITRLSIKRGIRHQRALTVIALAALVAVKLWVSTDVPLSVYGSAAHDDALFVRQATAILDGNWLGSFNEITLSKGPVYSLFLAGVGASGFRIQIAQATFHAGACLAVILGVWPLVHSRAVAVALFAVLLYDPHTLSAEVVGRTLRSGIHPALTLLTFAAFLGLAVRICGPLRRILSWAIFAGIAGSAFWFCREEGVWLAPSVLVMAVAAAGWIFLQRADRTWHRIGLLILPVAIGVTCLWTLRLVNLHFYDAAISMDVKDGNFPRAYGAMTRITPAERIPLVPVTKESRLRAYAVSPAFRDLRPWLEGPLGDGWSQPGWEGVDHPSAKKEMRGWFQWAVREAAARSGHYKTARTANEYWGRVADEINAACDRGALIAGPERSGFFPYWDSSLWPDFRRSWKSAFDIVSQFAGFGVHLNPSEATPEQRALFERITHQKAFDGEEPSTFVRYVRIELFHLYNAWGLWLTSISVIATLIVAYHAVRYKRGAFRAFCLIALLSGAGTLITLVALVNAAAFPAINGSYLSPATALLLAAWVLAPAWAWEILFVRRGPAVVSGRQ